MLISKNLHNMRNQIQVWQNYTNNLKKRIKQDNFYAKLE